MIDNSKIDALIHWDDTYSDSLRHWGIKGQKHGQRRFQNKDGSLTPLGRIRYGVGKAGDKIKESYNAKKEANAKKKLASKSVKDLTDEELSARIKRLTAEKQAADLERQISSMSPKQVSAGKKFISEFASQAIKPAVIDAGKHVLTSFLKKKGIDLAGLGEALDPLADLRVEAEKSKLLRNISENKRQVRSDDNWHRDRDAEDLRRAKKEEEARAKQSDNAQSGGKKKKNEADSSSTKPKDDHSNTSSEDAKTKSSETSTKQSTVVDAGKRQVESSINASRELNDLYSHYNRRAESAMDAMYSSGFMMTPVSML